VATLSRMCGRYASSRKPEDLVEEFEIDKVEVKETLAPDFNVAPTKPVYAVLQRPPRGHRA
jgi:putative SOS response-associated peptidase YedK